MTKWENFPNPPAQHPWWRRPSSTRSPYRNWQSSWRSEWGGPQRSNRGRSLGHLVWKAYPGRAACPEQGGGWAQCSEPNPTYNRGLISVACLGWSFRVPTSDLHLPNESGSQLQAGEGYGSTLSVCLPESRGMSVQMSWCAVLWTRPPPTKTSSRPSKRPRTRQTRPPARLRLPSRWAPACTPSLDGLWRGSLSFFLSVCPEEHKNPWL